jgi:hypothetical protein
MPRGGGMVAPSASSGETERNSMDTVGAHARLLENQTAKNHPRLFLHVIAYRLLFRPQSLSIIYASRPAGWGSVVMPVGFSVLRAGVGHPRCRLRRRHR